MTGKKLRIAMLSVHSCPVGQLGAKDTGGMNVYVREVARKLGRLGHQVDIYTRVHDPRDSQVVTLGQNARLIHLRSGMGNETHKLLVFCHLPEFACGVENFRKENALKYDLVFSNYWLSGLAGERLRSWWRVPHFITFHTLGAVKNAVREGEDEPELRIESERQLAQNCQRIIATTRQEKADLATYYGALPQSISVIPCGVDLELFQPRDEGIVREELGLNSHRIVLFVGRLEPLKAVDKLIEAMRYLDGDNLRLLIIGGDGSGQREVRRLKKLSQELRLEDKVSFLGMVKQEKLPYYYSAADVSVLPSYYESFGLVILESLACGTPVVTTRVGDTENIIREGENGYLAESNNPAELAGKIALLLAQTEARQILVNKLRNPVARFDWEAVAGQIAGEFELFVRSYQA